MSVGTVAAVVDLNGVQPNKLAKRSANKSIRKRSHPATEKSISDLRRRLAGPESDSSILA